MIDPDTRDTVVAVVVVLGFVAAVIAGMWRLWLKPFLQRELIAPVHETRDDGREVKDHVANTHQTNLRDDIDKIGRGVGDLASAVFRLQVGQEAQAAVTDRIEARLVDGDDHLDRLDQAIEQLDAARRKYHPGD